METTPEERSQENRDYALAVDSRASVTFTLCFHEHHGIHIPEFYCTTCESAMEWEPPYYKCPMCGYDMSVKEADIVLTYTARLVEIMRASLELKGLKWRLRTWFLRLLLRIL